MPLPVSPAPRPCPPHAVVIGAGVDGLLAAHALGRHLERVTLVERKDVPDRSARAAAADSHDAGALRRVLEAPQVVVRAGLEAVGLTIASGRVRGVEVCSRRVGATVPTVTIDADLVVDASGRRRVRMTNLPDGLVVIGEAVGAVSSPHGGRGITAELTAAVLARCLSEHLSRRADLTGFSVAAQRAVAQVGAGAPAAAR